MQITTLNASYSKLSLYNFDDLVNTNTRPVVYKIGTSAGAPTVDSSSPVIVNLQISEEKLSECIHQYSHYLSLATKEQFYIVAIKNLIRSNNYKDLNYQLITKQINEADFDAEIESNPEKYYNIESKPLNFLNHLYAISDIVNKIDVEMSVDEVADLFSITPDSIEYAAEQLSLPLQ